MQFSNIRNLAYASSLAVTAIVQLTPSSLDAQEISDDALNIGEREFYVRELVEIVYARNSDYRDILDCAAVLDEHKNNNGGLNSACVVDGGILYLSTRANQKRVDSAYICPTNQSPRSVDLLRSLSYENKEIDNGRVFFLAGLTVGGGNMFTVLRY